jgi:hydrogenase maturation protein HypF
VVFVRNVVIEVHGVVQGVGFRPHVHRLATGLGLRGDVRNVAGHVVIRAHGPADALAEFRTRLVEFAPPAARVDHVVCAEPPDPLELGGGFEIVASESGPATPVRVPPDAASCPACLRELFDPADRRYRYPFLNCADCGPRATIIDALPYDRDRTAMRRFPLCPACAREYHDPADRRFHAEAISCPSCGPELAWHQGGARGEAALAAACAAVAAGAIVAVKGIGGYQLVCDATDAVAVDRLRKAKGRPNKPLAVMAADLTMARALCEVDESAEAALTCAAAPIVLVARRPDDATVADLVAPGYRELGLILPYSPLHHLLLTELDRPLVVTSGNSSGSATITDNADARETIRPLVDGILDHNRPIRAQYDDSVVRPMVHGMATIRRARGLSPQAMPLPCPATEAILAVGGQLKQTTTLALGSAAMVGPHTGDLSDARTLAAFEDAANAWCRLHGVEPGYCAHDLHPDYASTRYARRKWPRHRRVAVQHHHAHVAATAAEHRLAPPFVGIALDGLGLGDDGTLWGGEVLLACYHGYRRFGRFATAPLPGGAAAVRRPARMALGYLLGSEPFGTRVPLELADDLLRRLDPNEFAVVERMIGAGVRCPRASSAGRLFDAAAALLGICDDNSYEGEAAALLEAAAAGREQAEPLTWRLHRRDGLLVYDPAPTLRHALQAATEASVGEVSARLHSGVAAAVVAMAVEAAGELAADAVCLGGGVFQNARLSRAVLDGLAAAGLRGYPATSIPTNDGGISYGQAVVAAAKTGRS